MSDEDLDKAYDFLDEHNAFEPGELRKLMTDEDHEKLIKYNTETQDQLNSLFSDEDTAKYFPDKKKLMEAKSTMAAEVFAKNTFDNPTTFNIARDCSALSISREDLDVELHFTLSHSTSITGENSSFNRMADVLCEVEDALEVKDQTKLNWVEHNGVPNLDIRDGGFVDLGNTTTEKDFVPALLTNHEFVLSAAAVRGLTNALSVPHNSRILQYLNNVWAVRGKNYDK